MLLNRLEDYVRETSKFEVFVCLLNRTVNIKHCFTLFSIPGIKDGLFKSLEWKQQNSDVEVYWDHINQREQSAFIQGYVLYWSEKDSNENFSVGTGIVTPR